MKAKVIEKNILEEFEEELSEFIKDKKIISIGYSTGEAPKDKKTADMGFTGEPRSDEGVGWWSALVVYEENKKKVSKKKKKK